MFHFGQQSSQYATGSAKINYMVNLLRAKASDWVVVLWKGNSPVLLSFDLFVAEMRKIFDHPVQGREAEGQLLRLRQGARSVKFAVDYHILVAESGWENQALWGILIRDYLTGFRINFHIGMTVPHLMLWFPPPLRWTTASENVIEKGELPLR